MKLARRIIAYGSNADWNPTEIDDLVEAVFLHERAKSGARWLVALVAVISFVVFGYSFAAFGVFVNTSWSVMAWVIVGLFVVVCAVITWLFSWPFAGRSEYWQNAVDFIEAIQYVESVTGRQFEDWSALDDVEKAIEKALVSELEAICAIQEKDPIKARDLFAKWRRRHEQMQRLFPSIKGYDELTTPFTFGTHDPQADSSVHYCSRS